MIGKEIELKLNVPPHRLSRLPRNAFVRSLRRGHSKKHHLTSVYFDTNDLALYRSGMVLRVRSEGARRTQTLKFSDRAGGATQARTELESEIATAQPELAAIGEQEARARVEAVVGDRPLEPVVETRVGRTVVPLQVAESDLLLTLDEGEIRAGAEILPLSEAELELVQGRPSRLLELALLLLPSAEFQIERRTKAGRGFDSLLGAKLKPAAAEPVELAEDATATEAIATVARNCLAQLGRNEAAVIAGTDPEGVHQMRVAARRLRALLASAESIFKPQALDYLVGELEWLMDELGRAREWDVFLGYTLAPLAARESDAPGLASLRARAEREREGAYEKARRALISPRYARFMLKTELMIETGEWAQSLALDGLSARELARDVLKRRHRKLAKIGSQHASLTEEDMHLIRIAAKKMRYPAEFFRSLFPRKAMRQYLKEIAELQGSLGTLNDAVIGGRLMASLGAEAPKGRRTVADQREYARGLVHGWQAAAISRDLSGFADQWRKFLDLKAFWKGH
jgi:inorganic triphosphatase YgiF